MGLLLVLPVTGRAQERAGLELLMQRGKQAGLSPVRLKQVSERAAARGLTKAQTAVLLEPAVQLAKQDLPAHLVLQKTLEGLAKNVPQARIQPVLERMRLYTEASGAFITAWLNKGSVQEMLAGTPTVDRAAKRRLIEGAVQARMHEIPSSVIHDLLASLPANTTRRPIPAGHIAAILHIVPDLPGGSLEAGGVSALLTAVLEAGYDLNAIRQLPAAMRVAVEQSNRPIGALTRGTTNQIARGTPAADVLSSLFNGTVPGGPPGAIGSGPPGKLPPGQGKTPGAALGPPDLPVDGPPGPGSGDGPPDGGPPNFPDDGLPVDGPPSDNAGPPSG